MRRIALVLVAATVTVAMTASAQPAASTRATMSGIGPIRVGMTESALERALGTRLPETQDAEEDECRQVEAGPAWPGTSVMLLNGRVVRIDVSAPGIRTLSGAAVGDSQREVAQLYGGRLLVTTHFHGVDDSKYLSMYSRDRRLGIRFETDGERITEYYVGTADAVQWATGCLQEASRD